MKDKLRDLKSEFTVQGADGKIYPAHKWKVETTKGEFAMCVPYVDARQVSERLNDVLGIKGWENTLIETSRDSLICELTLIIDNERITRSDVGVPSAYASEKGMASDALKRAAVKFGVGAYLYEMQPVSLKKVKKNGKIYASTDDGIALMTGADLTSYINMKHPLRSKLTEIYNSLDEKLQTENTELFTKIWDLIK